MNDIERERNARRFAERWKGRGNEKAETQTFWNEALQDILGVERPGDVISYEKPVDLEHKSFIDAYIPGTRVLIEQKSLGVDLDKPAHQSDGTMMTPFEQAKRYDTWLPASEHPRYIVVSNFKEIRVHDMERPRAAPEIIKLEDLPKEWRKLSFLADPRAPAPHEVRELDVSVKAGELVGKLYQALLSRYARPEDPASLRSLNVLCVRVVFLLYAEDAGLFPKGAFHDYLSARRNVARDSLIKLFDVLDQRIEERDPYLDDDLAAFPYVDGGLFAERGVEVPRLDEEVLDIILKEMAEGFDWSGISPTIFGAVFESTLNPATRRGGGMHYTSIENIHRVIDPLFLDKLKAELEGLLKTPGDKRALKEQEKKLNAFQERLAALTFLDPACGSGNFLTETYLSLRRLENRVLAELTHGQGQVAIDEHTPIKVSIAQFYGIEINDFAVAVARTALWIAEAQMMKETLSIAGVKIHDDVLPLKSYNHIVEGNALRMDWGELVPRDRLSFIMGNPPFRGARFMDATQKAEVNEVFKGWVNAGNLDYVSCWYKRASDLMKGTEIKAALVSTNSITQGEAVATLWGPLLSGGVRIDFAWRTFVWDSEATDKAHVHVVIVGFSCGPSRGGVLYDAKGDGVVEVTNAKNINGYLMDAPNISVSSRQRPLCDVPEIGIGNKPIDGGHYLFKEDEMREFIQKEPASAPYFHPWYGADEFINRRPRYCLYLGGCTPAELRKMPECLKRVEAVREFRLKSSSPGTRKLADTPTRFHVTNMPEGNYVLIPEVSSERRGYIPMGFMTPSVLCSNLVKLMPDATLYHFGVLESDVHMAWMRTVAGRLEMRYRYSKDIVYNNFPWPEAAPAQRERIEATAQGILDARALYPDSSLADLYDDLSMPAELRKAHRANDAAVRAAYGFDKDLPEEEVVARLMGLYERLAGEKKGTGGN